MPIKVRTYRASPLALLVLAAACSVDRGKPPKDVTAEFIRYYLDGPGSQERVEGGKFLGMPLIQTPGDMWIFQEILTEVRPDIVIETGTFAGGSALFFASVLEHVNPQGTVITMDIAPDVGQQLKNLPLELRTQVLALLQRRVEVFQSNSLDPKFIEWVTARVKGKKVLVTLDSCHNVDHVLAELKLYSPLVSVGSYLIVQDTRHDDRLEWVKAWSTCPGYKRVGGPGMAVDEFLRQNTDFEADRSRERYLLTFHPRGYLKRVR